MATQILSRGDTVRRTSASQLEACSNEGLGYFWHVPQRYTADSTIMILVANTLHATHVSNVLFTAKRIELMLLEVGYNKQGKTGLIVSGESSAPSGTARCCSDSAEALHRREGLAWAARHGRRASHMELGHVVVIVSWVGNLSTLAAFVIYWPVH